MMSNNRSARTEREWTDAAASIVAGVHETLERSLRKASEEYYAALLDDVQSYLLENATFNLKGKLEAERREGAAAWAALARVAEALGSNSMAWPHGIRAEQVADDAIARVARLQNASDARLQEQRQDALTAYRVLASIWFHGDFKAETFNERWLQSLMERNGWWPFANEAELLRRIEASDQSACEASDAAQVPMTPLGETNV